MPIPSDWGLRDQWHLKKSFFQDYDLNVLGAWSPSSGPGYSGAGVRVAVIDDGFDYRHPDLRPNYDRRADFDYVAGVADAFGIPNGAHGTAVAGLIAAAAGGGDMVGVAYGAEIVGYRVVFRKGIDTPALVADALENAAGDADVVNMSLVLDGPPPRLAEVVQATGAAVEDGRGGLGCILVKAAGNSRQEGEEVNQYFWDNDTRMVIVAGVDPDGRVSSYSNPGAPVLVSAFGTNGEVVTTDRTGSAGYTPWLDTPFKGTSAAAPMVSGVVALMLEAEDELGWRDVQSILAASARHVGSRIGGSPVGDERFGWDWNGAETWNGGGLHFSNDYGYGLVDATAAVRLAETWLATGAAAAASATEAAAEVDLLDAATELPRGPRAAFTAAGTLGPNPTVERVLVTVTLEAGRIQDFEAVLVSPSGTESALISRAGNGDFDGSWTFESQAFRGERGGGEWSVRLSDATRLAGRIEVSDVVVEVVGASGADDRYVFTDAFSAYAGRAGQATLVSDSNGGEDSVNAAATRADCVIRLDGERGWIDRIAVRFDSMENAIGGDGDDILVGSAGGNRLIGMRGRDAIDGGAGDDRLAGGWGDDRLLGGDGGDRMDGGRGNDRFVFRAAGPDGDVIVGFDAAGRGAGDRIDLGRIDADETRAGDQAFTLNAGTVAGSLRCIDAGADTRLVGHVDDDGVADFVLTISDGGTGAGQYRSGDFLL